MAFLSAFQQALSVQSISLESAFGAKDITTPAMQDAIRAWFELYYLRRPAKEQDPSQRIPYTVITKLTRTAFSEYETATQNAFAQTVLDALETVRKKAMQQGLIGGEALIKPIFPGKLAFSVIDRQSYYF